MLPGEFAVLVRIDDDEARLVVGEMPLDQGQGAFADRPEADHDDGAGNFCVDLRGGAHKWSPGILAGGGLIAFSSELGTGSRVENGSNKRLSGRWRVAWRFLPFRSSSLAC